MTDTEGEVIERERDRDRDTVSEPDRKRRTESENATIPEQRGNARKKGTERKRKYGSSDERDRNREKM